MFQTIVIVILLGIIGYLILDKKNIKLDDLKAFFFNSLKTIAYIRFNSPAMTVMNNTNGTSL